MTDPGEWTWKDGVGHSTITRPLALIAAFSQGHLSPKMSE